MLGRVLDCWTSLYGERVISYRARAWLHREPAIAVVVQRMVQPDTAGVMFTADPSTGSRDHIVIEAAFGLGEVVVSGQVEPDTYVLSKEGPRPAVDPRSGTRPTSSSADRTDRSNASTSTKRTPRHGAHRRRGLELGRIGLRVEAAYGGVPKTSSGPSAGGKVFVVQARPITTLDPTVPPPSGEQSTDAIVLVRGLAASAGIASGRVRVLRSPREGAELQPGEVLVAPMTNPDWVPTIRRAAAVVTDGGGMTCHAAIVAASSACRASSATRTATTDLHDGDVVTVDGARGTVSSGLFAGPEAVRPRDRGRAGPPRQLLAAHETARDTLYVNLAIADQAEDVAARPVDGVGLLRAEFMVTDALGGAHPRAVIARGGGEEFVARMADSLSSITRRSRRGPSCTARSTFARTSSAVSTAATHSSRWRPTR